LILPQLEKLDQAEQAAQKALSIDVNNHMALRAMAIIRSKQNKINDAAVFAKKAMALAPDCAKTLSVMANMNIQTGRFDDAELQLSQAMEINPRAEVYANYSFLELTRNNIPAAISHAETALKKKPFLVNVWKMLASLYQKTGQTESCIHSLEQVIKYDPKNTAVLSYIGELYRQGGEIDNAIKIYNETLAIKPDFAEVHSNLGACLTEQGRWDEAIDSLKKALTIKPDMAEAHNNLGAIYRQQGKLIDAIKKHKDAIATKPDFTEAHSNLGACLAEQGEWDEAINTLKKALAINPNMGELYNNIGSIYQKQGKIDDAIASYEKAIAIKPDFAEAYSNLGLSLSNKGEWDEAYSFLNKAIEINPDLTMARDNVLETMIKRRNDYLTGFCNIQRILDVDKLISANVKDHPLQINLLFCPFVDPITPPQGIASLKSYLEKYADANVHCLDLNLEWHTKALEKDHPGLKPVQIGRQFFKSEGDLFFEIDEYRKVAKDFNEFLKKSHTRLQFLMCQEDFQQQTNIINEFKLSALVGNPDIIGFSILIDDQILCSLMLARKIKEEYPEKIIVFGGAGILNSFDQIIHNPFVDFIITEAGEEAFYELLNSIQAGELKKAIPGVAYKKEGIVIKNKAIPADLNHDAYPDFSDHRLEDYFTRQIVIPILSSKGCFWRKCSFCEQSKINQYSEASIDKVVAEIEHHATNGHFYFQFVDEMISAKRLKELSKKIIDKKLRVFFYATLRPTPDFDIDTFHLMYNAGFRYVIWGVESCCKRVLKLVRKGTTVKSIRNTLMLSRNAGLRNHIFMFVGFPTEMPDELFETMQFLYDNRDFIHMVHSGPFNLCKGTEIFDNIEKFGMTLEYTETNEDDYKINYKSGSTSQKSMQYFYYYQSTFCDTLAVVPEFNILRDHALLYYAKFPIEVFENKYRKISRPIKKNLL